MKKTATITFHAAHNYGSVLQAFALQNVLFELGYQNEIINFRTERQKDLYTVFTKRKGIKYIIKNASHLLWYFPLKRQYDRFEYFISNYLKCSQEFNCVEDLKNCKLEYDVLIAGSDQIWNPIPADFDWAYYLPFAGTKKRISYASSFGQLASIGNDEVQKKIGLLLKDFSAISVREEAAKSNVELLSGMNADQVIDPTLLLSKEKWEDKLNLSYSSENSEDYLFFYTLFAKPEYIEIVNRFSKQTGLKVVTSNFSNQYDVLNHYKKVYDAGPIEFLDLIRNAKLIVTTSYHGTVFSILFNKPFYAINGSNDARISTLLKMTSLENRSVSIEDIDTKLNDIFSIAFSKANSQLECERKRSIDWLSEKIESI